MSWDRVCAEIEAEPRLSAAEERALWQAWKDGEDRCRRKLISCTLRFALGHAKSAARPGQRWEPGDLLGEATRAIAGCLERWDGTGSFAGYASARIRGTIQDFLRRKADVMRTPAGAARVLSLDQPEDGDGPTMLERREFDAGELLPDLPQFSKREREVLALTVLASPPGVPEDAAKALGLKVETVSRILRAALRKPAVAA
jgi:RNA polymerase sigma factor (sigma-70 family)